MTVFIVTKPGGITDGEFEAYVRLLEEIGVDISNAPRTAEPGTSRRWLHVWKNRQQAERFATELGRRTWDSSWQVQVIEALVEEHGPIAPLEIVALRTRDGITFRLHPSSLERVMRHFPRSRPAPDVYWATQTQQDYERQHGPIWGQVVTLLTGLAEEQLDQLGGYRIYEPGERILRERTPSLALGDS